MSERGWFTGKSVIITGAGSGIGRLCAVAFAREGGNIIAADRDVSMNEETVRLVEEVGA